MIARATRIAIRTTAITASRCCRKRIRTSCQYVRTGMRSTSSSYSTGRVVAAGAGVVGVRSTRYMTRLSVLDARIDDAVEDVADEVAEDHHNPPDHDDREDDGIVEIPVALAPE